MNSCRPYHGAERIGHGTMLVAASVVSLHGSRTRGARAEHAFEEFVLEGGLRGPRRALCSSRRPFDLDDERGLCSLTHDGDVFQKPVSVGAARMLGRPLDPATDANLFIGSVEFLLRPEAQPENWLRDY